MIVKGQKINDRYQVIRSIGEGGMANVYLAYDTILDRNVAVKVLRGDLATDEKFVRRFQREAMSASALSHPNIVEMYDVGEDDGNYFIVMEYIDGKTLKNLIKKRGALTVAEVVDIMLQLTSAISCAHDSYIIHRDIKPQNVMILDDGRVKITDFGIAIASNASELTQTNSVMGSVHYLPPEQANGAGATAKSDIYSLGILMFELLTGKLPFKGENAVEIALKQMKEQIPSVCAINPEIPQSIENVILKACAKNPKNRYDNVKDMYNDIKTALDEDRINETKQTYKFSEDDLDETKKIESLSEVKKNKKKETKEEDSTEKKMNLALIITSGVAGLLVLLSVIFFFVVPAMGPKDVKIPDVTGLTVEKAEEKLLNAGLEINVKTKEESSEDVKEGRVVKTEPSKNRTVKEGQKITLIVSTGTAKIKIEDYTGKNAMEVKGALELLGLNVTVEKKKVEETEGIEYDADLVIEQSVIKGKKLKKGDSIILFTPDVMVKYPNFVKTYTFAQVEEWASKNNVTVIKQEISTNDCPAGTIIAQDKPEGYLVYPGTSFTVTVAIEPDEDDNIEDAKPNDKNNNRNNN
ncbi:MAG: Stk1 family PASTA domain-containing Ser/Thr kinase [Tenericutes bacterium]|nr:Stk1 family PASTA domain-containing Ser/Thr kinase [Mycoplasmatota bacterium]